MSCHDEHTHSHDDHSHSHDHTDDLVPTHQLLLYTQLDFPHVTTLNESVPDAGLSILRKPFSERLSRDPTLTSDADAQLLMTVPFTGQVRLHSILLRTSDSASAPRTLKLFLNRDDLDFDAAAAEKATQTIELVRSEDVVEYPVRRALWNTTRCVGLFFEDNFSGDEDEPTEIAYLGFKGEYMKLSREAVNVMYEAAANPSDHKVKGTAASEMGSHVL